MFGRSKKFQREEYWSVAIPGEPGKAVHYMRPAFEIVGAAHFVTHIHVSLKHGGTQLLTVLEGSKIVGRFYVHGHRDIETCIPVQPDSAVTVYLDMDNTEDNVGALTVCGSTEWEEVKV